MSFGQWTRSGSNVYLTNSSDKVGVGTSSPSEKLHINGAIRGNEQNGALKIKTSGGYLVAGPKNSGWCHMETDRNEFYFNKPIFINSGKLVSYSTADLQLCTGESGNHDKNVRITIKNSNGNVGIGTTNPSSKLAVNGKITAKEVEITLTGWPDYVFGENYSLLPVKKLEEYIKENKHLPGIPSEQEVLENGVQVGDMYSNLLEKIEELTLYIIEQDKNTSELLEKITYLESEIKELKSADN